MHEFCSRTSRTQVAALLADVAAGELAAARTAWVAGQTGDELGLPILRAQSAFDGIALALENEDRARTASGLTGDSRARVAMVLARTGAAALEELLRAWEEPGDDAPPPTTPHALSRASTAAEGVRLAFFVSTRDRAVAQVPA